MKILLEYNFRLEGNEMKFNFILNLFKPNNKNITPLNLSFYIAISYELTTSNKSIFLLGKNKFIRYIIPLSVPDDGIIYRNLLF